MQAAGTVLAKEGAVTFDFAESARFMAAAVSRLNPHHRRRYRLRRADHCAGALAGDGCRSTEASRDGHHVRGTIVGPCLGVTTYMLALKDCHEGVVTTILATIPVMILPFSICLYGERVSLRAFGGAVIAVAGVAVLMWP